ncbi:MAG: carbamoyltransferase HypF, partial [Bacteroidales bacterium]|nr:carbamoyltransferase HypF [Bacteroidales bacterium]
QNSLKNGKIIAIKGIGGYLLIADATNREAISKLRTRKNRPSKPFALMYPSKSMLKDDVIMSVPEEKAFDSIEAPIVLFRLKNQLKSNLQIDLIAPNLNQIGVMNDYTPLFALILSKINFPIIATSGNISDSPIIFDDKKAKLELTNIADLIVANNREIVVPQDDSVIRFSPKYKQKIIIRRSRGLAPNFIDKHKNCQSEKTILAMGAGLKSSLGFYYQQNTYISQYLGNINSYESQQSYELLIKHWLSLFMTKPEVVIYDKHPQYFSSVKGKELANEYDIQSIEVQHHKAHFAAVLGENGLITSLESVLGVIWDGVGLGDDNEIWGGEFFSYQNRAMTRIYHFDYFTQIAFDKFAMEPRIPALSLCFESDKTQDFVKRKFTAIEFKNYCLLLSKENSLQTSSVGRLFDAVASLIGIADINSFEGEAAMKLENEALKCGVELDFNKSHYYKEATCLSTKNIINEIIKDVLASENKSVIALKFHYTLIKIIENIADKQNFRSIAFSGGVFQNVLLVDLLQEHLSQKFKLYFHKQLSPNDENISYGQLVYLENNIN